MGRPRTIEPSSEAGKRLLEACERLHGSVSRTARVADVSYAALRRRIYGRPKRADYATIEKLVGAGLPRQLLT